MQQEIQLNTILFTASVKEAEMPTGICPDQNKNKKAPGQFAFYTAKHDGACPIHKDDCNGAIEGSVDESELHYGNWLYTDFAAPKDRGHHFPVKISFFGSQADLLDDPDLINQLIDQVYQFSRIYWKSVSQQNLQVTIKYPEMVAEIFLNFTHDKIPDHGNESLWFL